MAFSHEGAPLHRAHIRHTYESSLTGGVLLCVCECDCCTEKRKVVMGANLCPEILDALAELEMLNFDAKIGWHGDFKKRHGDGMLWLDLFAL